MAESVGVVGGAIRIEQKTKRRRVSLEVGPKMGAIGEGYDDDFNIGTKVGETIADRDHMFCTRQSMDVPMKDQYDVFASLIG